MKTRMEEMFIINNSLTIKEFAQLLYKNGYEIGVRRLIEKMYDLKWIWNTGNNRKEPTRKAIRLGYLDVRKSEFIDKYGAPRYTPTTIVLEKGQQYIWDILRK